MNFDLFGNPIPANEGQPGRNEHAPDPEIERKIRVLLVAGWTKERIAKEVGLSAPTMNKHYFKSGKISVKAAREKARAEQRGRNMLMLDEQVATGNVTAIKAMNALVDEADREAQRQGLGDKPRKAAPSPLPKGKKEQMADDAQKAIDDNPDFAPGWTH